MNPTRKSAHIYRNAHEHPRTLLTSLATMSCFSCVRLAPQGQVVSLGVLGGLPGFEGLRQSEVFKSLFTTAGNLYTTTTYIPHRTQGPPFQIPKEGLCSRSQRKVLGVLETLF